jgi:4-diphosphocytidyl-2-C-methyl-D-erythritol kinase
MKAVETVTLQTPAKINLTLRVLGRRPDGYHEIESLMVPVTLFDEVQVRLGEPGIEVSCPGHPGLEGENNLAHRAASQYHRRAGIEPGVAIRISKNIPVQAGLGGGSSDAAATLLGLNRLLGRLSGEELFGIASELGADVPFFLEIRPALARGIGDRLTTVVNLPQFAVILAVAPFGLATAEMYESLNSSLTIPGSGDNRSSPVSARGLGDLASGLQNDLQPVGEHFRPIIGRVCRELTRAGAVGAQMTGSGPTVFGLFPTREQAMKALPMLSSDEGWQYLVALGMTTERRATE